MHGLEGLDIVGYSSKLLGEIRSKQLLMPLTVKHDCNNKSSEVKDCGGSMRTVTITTHDWEAGTYIDYFEENNVNFDYKAHVQERGLADAISQATDQEVVNAMNVDTHMVEFP